jgi:hypothetical protein
MATIVQGKIQFSLCRSQSILKPTLHGLRAEAHQMTKFAKRQPHLLAQSGDMADAASRIAGNVINGPKNGFSLICGLRIRRW